MRIGILVDGQGEFHGLRHLLGRIDTPHQIVRTLYCDIQPFAAAAQMALAASKRFSLLLQKKVDLIVILVDKETRSECTGELASAVAEAARHRLSDQAPEVQVCVVLKVTKFENWLVADPAAVARLPGLFAKGERMANRVTAGRADNADATHLLNSCCDRRQFEKVGDAVAICKIMDPARAAQNSRSFGKFLRVLESPSPASAPGRRAHGRPRPRRRRPAPPRRT